LIIRRNEPTETDRRSVFFIFLHYFSDLCNGYLIERSKDPMKCHSKKSSRHVIRLEYPL